MGYNKTEVEKNMEETRILIVEDEQIIVSSLKYLLGNMGYAVIGSTNTGEKAVEMTERLNPDLVLMDIILKGKMDGIRASELIHSRFQIPVVYLTAYMDKKLLKRIKVSEPFGYILKPFREKELQVAIDIAIFRHTMEEKLKHILDEWKSTFDAVQDCIMLLDKYFNIKRVNRATAVFLDKQFKEIIGESYYDLFHNGKIPRNCPLNKMRKTLRHEETVIFLADRKKWILVSVDPILDEEGGLKEAVQVLRDITQSKRAEEALEDSRCKLQELNQYLESVREKERTGIAREIHDELGQDLTALKMDAFWLKKRIPADSPELTSKLESMVSLIDNTLQIVKRITSALRPGILDDLGLSSAIEWQAQEFQKRTGITCQVKIDFDDQGLDEACSTALFRIFQESLTNITRHADAGLVKVSLKRWDHRVELIIADNGKGITDRQIQNSKSFGLIGMKERTRALKGELKIKGVKDKGTTITVRIPIKK